MPDLPAPVFIRHPEPKALALFHDQGTTGDTRDLEEGPATEGVAADQEVTGRGKSVGQLYGIWCTGDRVSAMDGVLGLGSVVQLLGDVEPLGERVIAALAVGHVGDVDAHRLVPGADLGLIGRVGLEDVAGPQLGAETWRCVVHPHVPGDRA